MKIFDWMHRRMKHDMSYYSKVPQGKGRMSSDISGPALENRSSDLYFGARKSAEALLLVELSNEAPAAAAAIYHVLGLEGILTIGTLGSSQHHYGRLGKEAVILEEDGEEKGDDGEEELAMTQHETASRFISQEEGKTKKSVALPRETLELETLSGKLQPEVAATEGGDEEMSLVEPLLAKAEEHDSEELIQGRITLRDLFLMSDDEYGSNNQYIGHNKTRTTAATIQNDISPNGRKDGHSVVRDKFKNVENPGTADTRLPADPTKGHQCSGKVIDVVPKRKKERDRVQSKFRRLIRRMTRTKIHPDVDLRKGATHTCFLPGKNINKEGQQNHESNKNNIKYAV